MNNYIIASIKPWGRAIFKEFRFRLPGNWFYIDKPNELTIDYLRRISPRYIFFLHWNMIVPEKIINAYECVCFHMTDVPYGRGGSPLQNLIARNHRSTKLSALRMVKDYDAGPVYLKEDLCLGGTAEEIFIHATRLSFEMMTEIIDKKLVPKDQVGIPIYFKRRTPKESEIPKLENLTSLHDFIRMLDAEGYPKAFLEKNGFRFEFSRACLYCGRIHTSVTITHLKQENDQ